MDSLCLCFDNITVTDLMPSCDNINGSHAQAASTRTLRPECLSVTGFTRTPFWKFSKHSITRAAS